MARIGEMAAEVADKARAGKLQPSECGDGGTNSLDPGHPLYLLWITMAEAYPGLWVRDHGEFPNETWQRALADVTPTQIGKGIDAVIKRGGKYPPSLPEFCALCTEQTHPAYREKLPPKLYNPLPPAEAVKRARKIREELGYV